MGAPTSPPQWASIPSVPWPWVVPPPLSPPSASATPQLHTPHSVQPVARPLAHRRLPPGAAPPMTRQQSIELLSPTISQSPGFNMPLLSSRAFSTPPNTPPADGGLTRTNSATFIPFASPPNAWVPPPIATGSSTIDTATVNAGLLPTPTQPSLPSAEPIGNLAIALDDRSNSNPATPVTSPPPSGTFREDGHYADPPVQRW
jgi:hypothetical protein